MRKALFILCTLFFVIVLFACISKEVRETDNPRLLGASSDPDEVKTNSKKTGGLEEIAVDSEKALQTYTFVKEQLAVSYPEVDCIGILKAFSQVVAGYNIVLICDYRETGSEGESEEKKLLYAKVNYNLDGSKELLEVVFDYTMEVNSDKG